MCVIGGTSGGVIERISGEIVTIWNYADKMEQHFFECSYNKSQPTSSFYAVKFLLTHHGKIFLDIANTVSNRCPESGAHEYNGPL